MPNSRLTTEDLRITDEQRAVVQKNMGLVYNIVLKIVNEMHLSKHDEADMIQVGTMGLMRAVQKHKPHKGALSTIATYWIRQAIQRRFRGPGVIGVPYWVDDPSRRRPAAPEVKRAAERARAVRSIEATDEPRSDCDPVEAVMAREERAAVRRAISRLPDDEWSLMRRRLDGQSVVEVGRGMRKSLDWVGTTEHRAHERLRGMLADYA